MKLTWSVALLLLILLREPCEAAPSLRWIFPAGGQRGSTVVVAVTGDGLADLKGLFATGTGLSAELLPPAERLRPPLVNGKPGEEVPAPDPKKQRQFRVKIAADAPLGRQEMRVYDLSGASNPRYFHIGDQPETVEREPNDESTGQAIETPVVINGRIQADTDQDIYTFRGQKGQRIIGEIYGLRSLGMIYDSWLKGYMELRDGAGKVLAANEGYYRWDPMIAYTLPADGEYSFMFRDLTFRGTDSAVYRLAVGVLPRATGLFPAGGRRGSTVQVRHIGENLGPEAVQTINILADTPLGSREIRLQAAAGWTNALPFEIGDWPEQFEQEPNDRRAQALLVTAPVTLNGRIDRAGDVDSFRFRVKKGNRLVIEVRADRAESRLDPFLQLFSADGSLVRENDDARERDSRIDRTFDADGEFVVQVRDLIERGSDEFVYRLTIAPPRPDFTLTATPDRPLIPAGGTAVLDLAVARSDGFDGEVGVHVADLAAGLSATSAVIRKGQERGRLTVTAATDVPAQALMLHVVGTAEVGGRRESRRAGTTETYNIQGTAFTRDLISPVAVVGRAAPVVLAAAPASVSVKGGERVTLTVRASRRAEAAGEIMVQLPNLPDGVTAEAGKIAAGAIETSVTLKADPDAPNLLTNLVLTAETKVGDGTFTATSPAISLTVVEAPGFSLSVEPKTLEAAQGSKAEYSFTVKTARRGGFDGDIELAWLLPTRSEPLPAGRIEAGRGEAQIGFKLPADMAAGAVEAKLVGKATVGGETRVREAAVSLKVAAAQESGK